MEKMHWRITISLVVLGLGIGQPLHAEAGTLTDLAPGMCQAEVVHVVGPPDAVRLERNGVVCLTYGSREHAALAPIFGQRTGVIVFKENRLVNYETVRTAALRFHWSDMTLRCARRSSATTAGSALPAMKGQGPL